MDGRTIDGHTVAEIDGTRLFRTEKDYCGDYLHIKHKGKEYYYHECSVLSLDALALNSPFINGCINLNIDAVIRVKRVIFYQLKK